MNFARPSQCPGDAARNSLIPALVRTIIQFSIETTMQAKIYKQIAVYYVVLCMNKRTCA